MSEAFSVDLPTGAACLGERDIPGALGTCILLHDAGQDLDRMRGMAEAVRRSAFGSLLVDLPGHGMSSGTLDADGPGLLAALLATDAIGRPVTAIAEGSAADLLLRVDDSSLAAIVLLSPRSDITLEEYLSAPVREVPTLVVLDPHDTPAVRVADLVASHARASWGRVFAHRSARSDSGRDLWPLRASDSAARFLAEKATFALYPRGSQQASLTENKRLS